MPAKNKKISRLVPSLISLEDAFNFIEDDILRKNNALTLQYIITLVGVMSEEQVYGTSISCAFYKNMILSYASIVESCLHYCLKIYFEKGKIESRHVMPKDFVYSNTKSIYKIDEETDVCGIIRHKKIETFNNLTKFNTIIKASNKAKILTKELTKRVHGLRELRNNIHLAGLYKFDDQYNQHTVRKTLNTTRIVVIRIKSLLEKIK